MNKTHYFCDACKKEVQQSELNRITIEAGQYQNTFERRYVSIELCVQCCEKAGLKKIADVSAKRAEPTTAERLYEIVCEIVSEIRGS